MDIPLSVESIEQCRHSLFATATPSSSLTDTYLVSEPEFNPDYWGRSHPAVRPCGLLPHPMAA
eukprot:432998-Pyramimonas_sp.AAC.1